MTSLPPFVPAPEPSDQHTDATKANQSASRSILSVRTGIDLAALYLAGRILALVYPPFGVAAGAIFEGANPFLTLCAIIATAYFTGTLWDATKEMREGSDKTLSHLVDTSRRELRAYVFPITQIGRA